jgi:2-hydroxychromene-2-carboxylate isomerase
MTDTAWDPLRSDSPLIVYLDFKSPYAYLAKDPGYALEDEFGIEIDWRPLTLDIPSYLGSAKADERGKVLESKRSPRQWSAVRYAYRDAKRYARLRDIEIKGTTKIWDTSLASIGMLWAKRQGRDVLRQYIDSVYRQFWRRELDVEDPGVISTELRAAGADVTGFDDYLAHAGRVEHDQLMASLHPAGIYGVPTFVIAGQRYFGREQLPLVRWHLGGEVGPAPDIAYESAGGAALTHEFGPGPFAEPTVYIDFKNPKAYLAIAPTRALEQELGVRLRWRGLNLPAQKTPDPAPDETTSQRHFRTRAEYNQLEIERGAARQQLRLGTVLRDLDTTLASIGLLLAEQCGCAAPYIDQVFAGLWSGEGGAGGLDVTSVDALDELLASLGARDFLDFLPNGRRDQATVEETAEQQGIIGVPGYSIGEHVFIGREHLPLLRGLLGDADE